MSVTPEDLRAAVAAGILTEAQAANLISISQDRSGQRDLMSGEDEPFEFFRGFSEIFIAVGLTILLSGILALLSLVGLASSGFIIVPLLMAGVVWWMAYYFTLRRRMILPSMILAISFGIAATSFVVGIMAQQNWPNPKNIMIYSSLAGTVAMGIWYWKFRLPVTMFFVGLGLLATFYAMTLTLEDAFQIANGRFEGSVFDLGSSSGFAIATLVFGIGAFLAGMWFDTRDPHRLGRRAATGFWLHLLAAPALVNTIALTLYNMGGTVGMISVALALTGITILALIIDRRSFLTAGIIYIALLISWVIQGDGDGSFGQWVAILLILGTFITALGTWWVGLRSVLMRLLPDFPGKSRLPPYSKSIEVP
ncbi:hypothetical protein [Pseudaestuariivita rosea]|uniref:hypothetical protein n=1 Tax=Pseudaestuariivita rosea TaxID=2763263 RepID=UPI001F1F7D7A|nr:hypothetical protein [Pseudaestuariivita rosea]